MVPYDLVMAQGLNLSRRDFAVLSLLEMTPVTVTLLRKASVTFGEEPFRDDRRVRERMQTLADAGLVRTFSTSAANGGLMLYYRLTGEGYRRIHPDDASSLPKTAVSEISPSRFHHTMVTAEVIVHVLVAAHAARIGVAQFHGDGKLTLEIGEYRQSPDCHFQFEYSGRIFNTLFEIDNATEPLDSRREQSLRSKLLGYELYQDWVLRSWQRNGRLLPRPRFRVVVLTKGMERAEHILGLARQCARNEARLLCYATTQDIFLAESRPLTEPILNSHDGHWRCLVNAYPSSRFLRDPIRLSPLARVPFL